MGGSLLMLIVLETIQSFVQHQNISPEPTTSEDGPTTKRSSIPAVSGIEPSSDGMANRISVLV